MQSQSGERSFAVTTEQIENLPINQRQLHQPDSRSRPASSPAALRPAATRLGGAGQNNIMMDGVSAMDTGNNGQMLNMNIESIGEVKILTQGYQAEYGRSSGLQITAVTKSGTNRFRGSVYDVEHRLRLEREQLGATSKNGDPKPISDEKDARLHDRRSGRQAGRQQQAVLLLQPRVPSDDNSPINSGNPIRLRVPTAAERSGDFSQSLDNNGALDSAAARARSTRQAVSPNNVIPASRALPLGLAILNRYPLPNLTQTAGTNYNYEIARRRTVENLTQQPAIRIDYQLSLEAARHRQVLRPARAPARHARHDSGLQRRAERRIPTSPTTRSRSTTR